MAPAALPYSFGFLNILAFVLLVCSPLALLPSLPYASRADDSASVGEALPSAATHVAPQHPPELPAHKDCVDLRPLLACLRLRYAESRPCVIDVGGHDKIIVIV